jgi:transcriptional regulator with XRE-family HTH domain
MPISPRGWENDVARVLDYRNFRSVLGSFSEDIAIDLGTANNLVQLRETDCVGESQSAVAVCDRRTSELQVFAIRAQGKNAAGRPPISITTLNPISGSKAGWASTEVVQTLGQLITEARERRGITREQAASQACLPAYYVKMIESGNYDAIPDPLYLLPFFRRYAAYLGLDAQEMTSRFIRDLEMAESKLAGISVPITMVALEFLVWRHIALGAFITGIVILLSLTAWRRIGIERIAVRHSARSPSAVAVSGARPSSAMPSMDVAPPAAVQQRGQIARAVAVQRPITTASAQPRMTPRLHAPAHRRRRGHRSHPNRPARP